MSSQELEASRVALVVAPDGGQGSGYLVRPRIVLTARHLIGDATTVAVRFGQWAGGARVAWAKRDPDLAVLMLERDPPVPAEPVRFGRLTGRDAIVPCRVVGFPRFKLRRGEGCDGLDQLDTCHLAGEIPTLSNRREGTAEIVLEHAPSITAAQWTGLSGAALWCEGLIVGVVWKAYPAEGPGRLTATRLDACYDRLDPESLAELGRLTGLPATVAGLRFAVGRQAGGPDAQSDHVRRVGPRGRLIGREDELAEMAAFCHGREPYLWWQAPPWSGKTALASWFVQHPPAGVQVAPVFIRFDSPDWASSDGYLPLLIERLAQIAGTVVPLGGGREERLHRVLRQAADQARRDGGRLVLVIDGLDEDLSRQRGQRGILSLLRDDLPEDVRIIVTSRLPPGHLDPPCLARALAPSGYAAEIGHRVMEELDQTRRRAVSGEIIALLAAARGGLMPAELAELTGYGITAIQVELDDALSRIATVLPVISRLHGRGRRHVVQFSHATLSEAARRMCRDYLDDYLARLDRWAAEYRGRSWPDTTPGFLFTGYPRLLADSGRTRQFAELVTDARRHERMMLRAHTDEAALAEVTLGRDIISSNPSPDLVSLARLTLEYERLLPRNKHVPAGLPGLWARVGELDGAQELARSLLTSPDRHSGLTAVVREVARTDPERACALARSLEEPALVATALAAAAGAMPDRCRVLAEATAREADQMAAGLDRADYRAGQAVSAAIRALARWDTRMAGDYVLAQDRPSVQALGLLAIVVELAVASGDAGRVRTAVEICAGARHAVRAEPDGPRLLSELAKAVAPAEPGWAVAVAADLLASDVMSRDPRELRSLVTPREPFYAVAAAIDIAVAVRPVSTEHASRLASLVIAAAQRGGYAGLAAQATALTDPERAAGLARVIENDVSRDSALGGVVRTVIDVHPDQAGQCVRVAMDIGSTYDRARALAAIAEATALTDSALATRAIEAIGPLEERARALTAIGYQTAPHDLEWAARLAGQAESLARAVGDLGERQRALAVLAEIIAPRDGGRAERCVAAITSPGWRIAALTGVLKAGGPARLLDELRAAYAAAGDEAPPPSALVAAAAAQGRPSGYLIRMYTGAAARIRDPALQVTELAVIAAALATARPRLTRQLVARGNRKSRKIAGTEDRARAQAALAVAAAAIRPALAAVLIQPAEASAPRHDPAVPVSDVDDPGLAAETASVQRVLTAMPGARVTRDGLPWQIAALADVAAALGDPHRALASRLAEVAESAARTVAGRDARALALAIAASGFAPWQPERARRIVAEATGLMKHVYADRSAGAASRLTVIASRICGPRDARLLAAVRQALARELAGPCWIDTLPGLAVIAPEAIAALCDAITGPSGMADQPIRIGEAQVMAPRLT